MRLNPSHLPDFSSRFYVTRDLRMKEDGFDNQSWLVRRRGGKDTQKLSLEQSASEFFVQSRASASNSVFTLFKLAARLHARKVSKRFLASRTLPYRSTTVAAIRIGEEDADGPRSLRCIMPEPPDFFGWTTSG